MIERPASVVKELLENSVDAGATRIDVTVEQGGGELIRVADNGCGIAADELPLAVASHATSKIREADDLFRVAHARLPRRSAGLDRRSQPARSSAAAPPTPQSGAELEVVGGQPRPIAPVGCPVGTTIEVRNLFFNTPVRHKFLRSTQTEMGHTTEAFTRLALAHPHVHFTLTHNGRLDARPAAGRRRPRADRRLLRPGARRRPDRRSRARATASRSTGFVANPMHSRATGRMQYLFLNGRAIRDRSLQHALGEAYRGLLLTGR